MISGIVLRSCCLVKSNDEELRDCLTMCLYFLLLSRCEKRSTEKVTVRAYLIIFGFYLLSGKGVAVKRSAKLSADVFCCLYFVIEGLRKCPTAVRNC